MNINGENTILPDWVNRAVNSESGDLLGSSPIRATNETLIHIPDNCKIEYELINAISDLRIVSYYYDDNKELITVKNNESSMSVEANYIRYFLYTTSNSNIDINTINDMMIIKITKLDCIAHEIDKLKEDAIKITDGKNKYDSALNEDGYLSANGSVSGNNYFTTGFINLQDFKYGISINKQARKILFYTDQMIPISGSLKETTPAGVLELNADYKYMRVSFYYSTTNIMICDSTSIEEYETYERIVVDGVNFANKETLAKLNTGASSILNGKKWAVCGDSFTAGADTGTLQDGKYAGQKIVYPYIIGNNENINILNFFQNGRTLAYPEDGTFSNSLTAPDQAFYYQNIPEDVDYITIYLGINDLHHEEKSSSTDGEDVTGIITLGTIDDNTTATYYGAWNVVLSWLLENRPFAHIGIIVSNGLNENYRNAQLAIAKKFGIPYIDMNGDDRTPCMIRSCNPNVSSNVKRIILLKQSVDYENGNTHPSNATHEYESTFITNFLKSL